MYDKRISVGRVVAYGLWTLTVLLLAASWGFGSANMGRTAIVFSAVAATAHIRQFFVMQNDLLRNAFELGQDSITGGGHVSNLKRSRVTLR